MLIIYENILIPGPDHLVATSSEGWCEGGYIKTEAICDKF